MRTAIRPVRQEVYAVVLIPLEEDWNLLRSAFPDLRPGTAIGQEWTSRAFGKRRVVFLHTGEDLISAAASAQHAADQWRPGMFLIGGAVDEITSAAFQWVAARNRIMLQPATDGNAPIPAVLAVFGAAPSEPDPVVAGADSSTE